MNFFGMGPMELGVILVIALIVFGPGKLPEIGAQIGKGVRDFKAVTNDLTGEFQQAVGDVKDAANEVKQSAAEIQDEARSVTRLDQRVTPATAPSKPKLVSQDAPAPAPAEPSKADPLADLMG